MADRRMFSKEVVRKNDAFLDLPLSAQALYFHLGMEADDDGVVGSPKSVMRSCNASQSDMDELVRLRYILPFPSGAVVIKHWKMSNYIPKDRYKPSAYVEELSTLGFDDKGAYTEIGKAVSKPYTVCIQDGDIGKDRIGKDRIGKVSVCNYINDCDVDNFGVDKSKSNKVIPITFGTK